MKSVPGSAIGTITMVFGAFGALAGGYIAVRIARCRGMMYGILTGLVLFLVVVIVGVCSSSESVTIATVIKGIAMLLSGAIGGIVAVNKNRGSDKQKPPGHCPEAFCFAHTFSAHAYDDNRGFDSDKSPKLLYKPKT